MSLVVKNSETDDRTKLLELLEVWYAAAEDGEPPALESLCVDCPELLDRLRSMVLGEQLAVNDAKSDDIRSPGAKSAPERLPGYRLLSLLGEGGMGQVHLAYQESLRRLVAIKLLDKRLVDGARRVRFQREAEIVAALEHPNIVPVIELGENEDWVWIVMKRLRGRPLSDLSAPMPWREAVEIGAKVARALDAAHLLGIVHRDVKPSNIIADETTPYLLDFGLARGLNDATLTREDQTPGTLPYMAPEQLRGTPVLDPRIDVYGLGATIYELVSGVTPFAGDQPESTIQRILFQPPPPMALAPEARDLEVLLRCALEKDPTHRFASAAIFAEELERLAAGAPIRTRPPSLSRRFRDLVRRHKKASALIATIALLFVVVLFMLLWQRADQSRERQRLRERVYSALQESRWEDAWDDALAMHVDDPERSRALAEISAALDREALLDFLLADYRFQDKGHTAELAARVESSTPSFRAAPLTQAALAIAELSHGNREQSVQRLFREEIASVFPRLSSAAVILLRGSWEDVEMPAPASAEDAALTAMAFLVCEQPEPQVRFEVESALRIETAHKRSLRILGYLETNRGRLEEAKEIWRGLVARSESGPEDLMGLWLVAHESKDRELAERCVLDARNVLVGLGRKPWLTVEYAGLLNGLNGDPGRFPSRLDQSIAVFGARSRFSLLHGQFEYAQGRLDNARARFQSSLDEADSPASRRLAELALLEIDLQLGISDGREDLVDLAKGLYPRALAIAEGSESVDRVVRARAQMVMFTLFLIQNLLDPAWTVLGQALQSDSRNENANHQYARFVFTEMRLRGWLPGDQVQGVSPLSSLTEVALGSVITEARRRAQSLVSRIERDPGLLGGEQVEELVLWEAIFAWRLEDREGALRGGRRAHELLTARGADSNEYRSRWLADLRAGLGLEKW